MTIIPESLLQSWQESLEFIRPKNLGLMLLISLRTLLSLYWSLFFALFLPTALLAGLVFGNTSLICAFYMTVLVRAARPAMGLKRTGYWGQIVIADWILFLGLLLLFELPRFFAGHVGEHFAYSLLLLVSSYFLKFFFLEGHLWLPGADALGNLVVFLSPFVILWTLFMLDAQLTVWQYVKAFGRAAKMMVYNYPFFLVVYEVVRLLIAGAYLAGNYFFALHEYLAVIGWAILLVLFIPYYVCFITNFYVRRLHDQFSLYY